MVATMTRGAGATRQKYEPGPWGAPRSRWTGVVLMLAVLVGEIAANRPVWADPAQVESLIAEGNEMRGQLGLAALAASYPVEAADHLSLALESPDHPWVASNRKSLERALTKARS